MNAANRSTPSLAIPQTQNTAPVLEFNCLYTHDIRRKQKRWQDGFLRFHTFNKRVMVYDVPRNFIGDLHWAGEGALQEGDEMTLEKDGVIVQVADSVGSTETDLSELRKSRKKTNVSVISSPTRSSAAIKLPHGRVSGIMPRGAMKQPTPMKHKSLNSLLGTPGGRIGKAALPEVSPYQQRHMDSVEEQWATGRTNKRRRINERQDWNELRRESQSDKESVPQRNIRPLSSSIMTQSPFPQRSELIDLTGDESCEEVSLCRVTSRTCDRATDLPHSSHSWKTIRSQRSPDARTSVNASRIQSSPATSEASSRQRSRSMSSRSMIGESQSERAAMESLSNGIQASRPIFERSPDPVTRPVGAAIGPNALQDSPSKKNHLLRLTTKIPKKNMLICQDQLSRNPAQVGIISSKKATVAEPDHIQEQRSSSGTAPHGSGCTENSLETTFSEKRLAGIAAAPKQDGPWSREAFDLFNWRPPDWDEQAWCIKVGDRSQ